MPVEGDTAAFVGENRRMLVVDARRNPGDGARPRRDPAALSLGGLADAKVFRTRRRAVSWRQGESRTRTEFDLTPWRGPRGGAGRSVPQGFPRSGKFG